MKIIYDRPKISSSTINQGKDFKHLIQLHKAASPFYQKGWFISSAILACLATLFLATYWTSPSLKEPTKQPQKNIVVNTDSIHTGNDSTSYLAEETPCVTPPISTLNIPFQNILIAPQKAQTIEFEGAKLHIPANAFINKDNQKFSDSILLKFRVFRDPVDFIISGIPMEYDSLGITYTFESGGMFELRSESPDTQTVYIDQTKQLEIELELSDKKIPFNFYALNEQKETWKFLSGNTLKKTEITYEQDKTHSFDDPSWKSTYRAQNIAQQKWKKAEALVTKHQKTKPIAPQKLKENTPTFSLDVEQKQFPELAAFKTVQFKPIESSGNIQEVYHTEWNSIQLKPHTQKMTYQLILKNDDRVESVIAQPVYEGKNWAKAQHIYGNKFAEYVAILEQKEEAAQTLKEDYEKKKKLFDERDKLKSKAKEVVSTAILALAAQVTSFGIFNFDRPIIKRPKMSSPPENSIELQSIEQPKFLSSNNEFISFDKIYIIESKRNASFTYNLNKNNYFSYNPQSKISIIGIKNSNQLYLVNKTNFKDAVTQNTPFITTEIKNTSLEELKKIILKT